MGKIKDVLNSISKDDKTVSRSDSKATVVSATPRRASKASSKEVAASIGSAVVATPNSTPEDSKRLSTQVAVPSEVRFHRSSAVEPLSAAIVADTESQKVAAPVTHNLIKHKEVEEITRAREHDKHVYEVQHHVQPVHDSEILEEVHHTNAAPVTEIHENIEATAEDAAAYENLGSQFKDEVIHAPTEKRIIDHGEKVHVKEHRHVHHVVQPVIEKETHERHRIHTTIPIHQVTHEAPIIKPSINHEPLNMDEFLKRGGSVNSGLSHTEIGKTLLTEKRISGVLTSPTGSVAGKSDITALEADVSKKLNI